MEEKEIRNGKQNESVSWYDANEKIINASDGGGGQTSKVGVAIGTADACVVVCNTVNGSYKWLVLAARSMRRIKINKYINQPSE